MPKAKTPAARRLLSLSDESYDFLFAELLDTGNKTIFQADREVREGVEKLAADLREVPAVPDAEALEALRGLLAQIEGPAMVHGDGRGNDGRKTGLSGDEFRALRDKRIAAARAVLGLPGELVCEADGPHLGTISKLVPYSSDGNMILCRACFNRQAIDWRADNIERRPQDRRPIPTWASLKPYNPG